jgi:sugar O-acyltransferase (sialic acid O-acetyltransferase NeuD family)
LIRTQKIAILGAGGFGREVLDILIAQNRISKKWKILGFIDENPELHGEVLNGYPVLGSFDWFSNSDETEVKVICAVGDNTSKKKMVERAQVLGLKFANVIHPSVVMTDFVTLGEGVVICAGCILTNQITIGNHVIINLDVTIGHDTIIENYCTLSPGVHISGRNKIEEGANIGTGAVTIQGITIGRWSIIGAGAVVVQNIPDNVVAVGTPAKPIKRIEGAQE